MLVDLHRQASTPISCLEAIQSDYSYHMRQTKSSAQVKNQDIYREVIMSHVKAAKLGRILKAVRFVEGKTQEEVAQEIGVSRRSIVRYETTAAEPHPLVEFRIRKWLENANPIHTFHGSSN